MSPLPAETMAPAAVPVATPVPKSEPAPAPRARHVFVIIMENRAPAEALDGRYIASLAREYAIATSYVASSRPSLPNYLALTAGDTFGIRDDAYHALAKGGLGTQLTAAGLTWRAYMEGMTKGCFDSPYPYALKHNPFAYYGGGCPDNVVPLSALRGRPRGRHAEIRLDHAGHVPRRARLRGRRRGRVAVARRPRDHRLTRVARRRHPLHHLGRERRAESGAAHRRRTDARPTRHRPALRPLLAPRDGAGRPRRAAPGPGGRRRAARRPRDGTRGRRPVAARDERVTDPAAPHRPLHDAGRGRAGRERSDRRDGVPHRASARALPLRYGRHARAPERGRQAQPARLPADHRCPPASRRRGRGRQARRELPPPRRSCGREPSLPGRADLHPAPRDRTRRQLRRRHRSALGGRLHRRRHRGARRGGRAAARHPHRAHAGSHAGAPVGGRRDARGPGRPRRAGGELLVRLRAAPLLARALAQRRGARPLSRMDRALPGARPVALVLRARSSPLAARRVGAVRRLDPAAELQRLERPEEGARRGHRDPRHEERAAIREELAAAIAADEPCGDAGRGDGRRVERERETDDRDTEECKDLRPWGC